MITPQTWAPRKTVITTMLKSLKYLFGKCDIIIGRVTDKLQWHIILNKLWIDTSDISNNTQKSLQKQTAYFQKNRWFQKTSQGVVIISSINHSFASDPISAILSKIVVCIIYTYITFYQTCQLINNSFPERRKYILYKLICTIVWNQISANNIVDISTWQEKCRQNGVVVKKNILFIWAETGNSCKSASNSGI